MLNALICHTGEWAKLKRPQFIRELRDDLVDCLVHRERRIEPKDLQVIFNNELISLEQLALVIQLQMYIPDRRVRRWLPSSYLNFLKENETSTNLNFLYSSIRKLTVKDADIEIDENRVMKLKNLKKFSILSSSPRIGEALFRRMLTTWTNLEELHIKQDYAEKDIREQLSQHQLEQMTSYFPNLIWLFFVRSPESLKFVTEFKNLKILSLSISYNALLRFS